MSTSQQGQSPPVGNSGRIKLILHNNVLSGSETVQDKRGKKRKDRSSTLSKDGGIVGLDFQAESTPYHISEKSPSASSVNTKSSFTRSGSDIQHDDESSITDVIPFVGGCDSSNVTPNGSQNYKRSAEHQSTTRTRPQRMTPTGDSHDIHSARENGSGGYQSDSIPSSRVSSRARKPTVKAQALAGTRLFRSLKASDEENISPKEHDPATATQPEPLTKPPSATSQELHITIEATPEPPNSTPSSPRADTTAENSVRPAESNASRETESQTPPRRISKRERKLTAKAADSIVTKPPSESDAAMVPLESPGLEEIIAEAGEIAQPDMSQSATISNTEIPPDMEIEVVTDSIPAAHDFVSTPEPSTPAQSKLTDTDTRRSTRIKDHLARLTVSFITLKLNPQAFSELINRPQRHDSVIPPPASLENGSPKVVSPKQPDCALGCLSPVSRLLALAEIAGGLSDSDSDDDDREVRSSADLQKLTQGLAKACKKFCKCGKHQQDHEATPTIPQTSEKLQAQPEPTRTPKSSVPRVKEDRKPLINARRRAASRGIKINLDMKLDYIVSLISQYDSSKAGQ